MSWRIQDVLKWVSGESPIDMLLVNPISAPNVPGVGQSIEPDECYVELYVESLRLTKARKFATRFHGLVYSFVSLVREGADNSELAAVSKPEKLAELDSNSLDKVITVSKRMMGAVPWRGGTFGLQLGLFSVKAGNLLSPVLDYVTKVSSAAGASFVGVVKPFLPLITEGMDLITGQRQDTAFEVGYDTDLHLTTSGVGAIIAAPKDSINPAEISLDPSDHKLLLKGKPLQLGYCVFSIRRTDQKADYGEIPELKEKYAAIQAAIKANKRKEALDALTSFRLATFASSDLISSDARKLVQKAEQKIKDAFPAGGVSLSRGDLRPEALSEIGLYE